MHVLKHFILTCLCSCSCFFQFGALAQNTAELFEYKDATQLRLVGKAMEGGSYYHRIDTAKYHRMRLVVKRLFTQSAGLAIAFKTNSPVIKAKWKVTSSGRMANMTGIAQKGLDLYIKRNGQWEYAGVGAPSGVTNERILSEHMGTEEKECLLYLPLYDELKQLEIGVQKGSTLVAGEEPFRKKFVIYGSSILQGASASRPGMAYPARLSRSSGCHFLNLGLSGSGKMEPEVAEMLADIDADAFILDCIPNPSPAEITERTVRFVQTLRQRHPEVPILLIQTVVREKGNFDERVKKWVQQQNEAISRQVDELRKQGVKHLYFLREDRFLGTDHEGTTDGVHPNDLGFDRMLQKYKPFFRKVLKVKFHD